MAERVTLIGGGDRGRPRGRGPAGGVDVQVAEEVMRVGSPGQRPPHLMAGMRQRQVHSVVGVTGLDLRSSK